MDWSSMEHWVYVGFCIGIGLAIARSFLELVGSTFQILVATVFAFWSWLERFWDKYLALPFAIFCGVAVLGGIALGIWHVLTHIEWGIPSPAFLIGLSTVAGCTIIAAILLKI